MSKPVRPRVLLARLRTHLNVRWPICCRMRLNSVAARCTFLSNERTIKLSSTLTTASGFRKATVIACSTHSSNWAIRREESGWAWPSFDASWKDTAVRLKSRRVPRVAVEFKQHGRLRGIVTVNRFEIARSVQHLHEITELIRPESDIEFVEVVRRGFSKFRMVQDVLVS